MKSFDLLPVKCWQADIALSAASYLSHGISGGPYFAFIMVLLRFVFRWDWLTIIAFTLLGNGQLLIDPARPISYIALLHWAAMAIVLTRYGVVAVGSFIFCNWMMQRFPMTADLAGPDVATSVFVVIAIAVCAGYGFFTAVGSRPFWSSTARSSN